MTYLDRKGNSQGSSSLWAKPIFCARSLRVMKYSQPLADDRQGFGPTVEGNPKKDIAARRGVRTFH